MALRKCESQVGFVNELDMLFLQSTFFAAALLQFESIHEPSHLGSP